jgi:endo-1,4-beta-xylanase
VENHSLNVTDVLYSATCLRVNSALYSISLRIPQYGMNKCTSLFRAAVACLVLFLTSATSPTTLRQTADKVGILVGTAVRPPLFSETAYSATLGREFNMLEPEDAMKWWTVRHTEDVFDFREGDEIVAFAKAHGMKVRGHCLVWDHNNPEWLVQGHFSPDRMSQLLQQHIERLMQHYAGQVFAWDVVNEALDENGEFKDSPWYNQPGVGLAGKGPGYVEQAFRWAHAADPKALLFYNENGAEGLNRKSDAVYAMVKDFRRRGVPIDGVGLQMHISGLDFDTSQIAPNIRRLTELGLQVHITELDVSLPVDSRGSFSRDDLEKQAEIYRGVVRACMLNSGCTAVQTWGFTDKYSWIGSHSRHTHGGALPFDNLYRPKPAYDAMIEEIAGRASH